MHASYKLGRWGPSLSEIKFDVVHRSLIEHEAAGTLSRLPTTKEDYTQIQNALPVLLVASPTNEDDKVCIETIEVIEDYNDTGISLIFQGLPTMCLFTTSKRMKNSTLPTLT